MVPGGFEVLERRSQFDARHHGREAFYLQIIHDTGDTLDLVADGARNILEWTD